MNRSTTLALLALAALLASCGLWWRAKSFALRAAEAERAAALRQTAEHFSASTAEPAPPAEDNREDAADAAARDPRVTKLFQHLKGGPNRGRISREALETYLEERGRDGLSLLAAWQESGDDEYLREAAGDFPDDPNVQLAAALSPAFAADHAVWRERLKQSDPESPLPYWLAAAEHFSSKQSGLAVAELLATNGKNTFDAHVDALLGERQALFEAAGFDRLRAQIEARSSGENYGYLTTLQQAHRSMAEEVKALRSRGEVQTAQDLSVTALNLGRLLAADDGRPFVEVLVGLSIENDALQQIPTPETVPVLGSDGGQRAAELKRRMNEVGDLLRNADVSDGRSPLEEVVEFFQRAESEGELPALRWLAAQRAGR